MCFRAWHIRSAKGKVVGAFPSRGISSTAWVLPHRLFVGLRCAVRIRNTVALPLALVSVPCPAIATHWDAMPFSDENLEGRVAGVHP
ncbi:hypothetical protein BS50DRAFT_132422 [Corynespora cassiicola Philippines]|uniref:Uncharacterized protein n=1 Tax=Corynespora cassiicola Philippines TaxID=1448308 RepID=A0A2T2NBV1_CORCC|nr:hypothetical protein BS50DRAFT_132422 [Corynespora cassiicola Philippines]